MHPNSFFNVSGLDHIRFRLISKKLQVQGGPFELAREDIYWREGFNTAMIAGFTSCDPIIVCDVVGRGERGKEGGVGGPWIQAEL